MNECFKSQVLKGHQTPMNLTICCHSVFILDSFRIQHIPSGRCLSFQSGANNDQITLKAACNEFFRYDTNGGLKHITSGSCVYLDSTTVKMSSSFCNNGSILYRTTDGILRFLYDSMKCLAPAGTGIEAELIQKSTTCDNRAKFRYIGSKSYIDVLT